MIGNLSTLPLMAVGSLSVVLVVVWLVRTVIRVSGRLQERRRRLAAISVSVEAIRARQNHPYLI